MDSWIYLLSSEVFFWLFSLFLYLAFCYSSTERLPLYSCVKVGRVMDIDRARLTHSAALPMASTEAVESQDFSVSAYKIPGQGCNWSSLIGPCAYMCRAMRMTREMEDCDWPGRAYCLSLRSMMGKCMIDNPAESHGRRANSPKQEGVIYQREGGALGRNKPQTSTTQKLF